MGSTHSWFRTILAILGSLVLLGLITGYILFQARLLIAGPQIVLIEEPPRVVNERFVTLRGHARNITHITLNGRPIFTDQAGYFQEAMMLENGYTIATIAATDRYGRTTAVSREFVFLPASIVPSTTDTISNE